VIDTKNEPSTNCAQDEEENRKNVIQDYQKCIYTFHRKGNVGVQNSKALRIAV